MKTTGFRRYLKSIAYLGGIIGFFGFSHAFAGATQGLQLSDITKNVDSTVGQLARIISDVSLMAGIGFVMASFFKFHQHKLNPTQVPISQGVTLLLIGAALLLFPTMLPTAKNTVFGSASMAQVGGSQIAGIINASSGGN